MAKKILAFLLILLLVAVIAFYIYDIVFNDTSPGENFLRMLAVVVACVAGLVRIFVSPRSRKRLGFYETQYAEQIQNAFCSSFRDRKKLLCAIRLYNEKNYAKAAKYLISLKPRCRKRDDYAAVGVFLALVLTDMGLYKEAIYTYEQLIDMNLATSTIYSNLGHLHSHLGNYKDAASYFTLAIQNNPQNAYAYNNLAHLYFDTYDLKNAVKYAEESLALDHKCYAAASLLAIIYSVEEDTERAEKYFHMAIAGGQNPDKLKERIVYYKSAKLEKADETMSAGRSGEHAES